MDGLDATWSYLSRIGRMSRGKKEYPLPLKPSELVDESEEEEESSKMGLSSVDLDEQEEIVKNKRVKGKKVAETMKRKLESPGGEQKAKKQKEEEKMSANAPVIVVD